MNKPFLRSVAVVSYLAMLSGYIVPADAQMAAYPAQSAPSDLFATQTVTVPSTEAGTPLMAASEIRVIHLTSALLSHHDRQLHIEIQPVVASAVNQWKPYSQIFSLSFEGRTLAGEAFWLFDYVYVRLGNRWVRFPSGFDATDPAPRTPTVAELPWGEFPWENLLHGPLLLANPELQEFIQYQNSSMMDVLKPLPSGAELVVEKAGFTETHYSGPQITSAVKILRTLNPMALLKAQGYLDDNDLFKFLNAYLILAASGPGYEDVWDHARMQLNFLIGVMQDRTSHLSARVDELYLIRILGEKRKFGFNYITGDLVKELREIVAQAVIPNGEILLLTPDGQVTRSDALNQGNWVPMVNAPQIRDLAQAARAGGYSRYVTPYLMYGGNATRIRDTVFGNKVTAAFFAVEQDAVDALTNLFEARGLRKFADSIQMANNLILVTMLHVLVLLMPNGIYLAGSSSLASGAQMVGSENQLLQNVAHQFTPDGTLKEMTTDLAGHGDAFKELISDKKSIEATIAKGGVFVLTNAEYYDPSMYEAIAMQVVSGKNASAFAVFPQSVKFHASGIGKIAKALQSGKEVTVVLRKGEAPRTVQKIQDGVLIFADGSSLPYEKALDDAGRVWSTLSGTINSSAQLADVKRQRDEVFDSMSMFETEIVQVLSPVMVTIPGEKKPVSLFEIETNDGGMLSDVNGVVNVVEKSQFGSTHTLRKSDGTELLVSRKTIEAIWFRDFNMQFFGWDSFAVKACLTTEAKQLYHEYLNRLETVVEPKDQEDLRAEYAEKIKNANPNLTLEEWKHLTETLDLLQTVMTIPPFESKKDAEDVPYVKINKMAQQVMTFMMALSMSNISMEDIDLHELRQAVERLKSTKTDQDRMVIRNDLKFKNGKSVADLAVKPIGRTQVAGLVRVNTDQFVQVKKPEDAQPFAAAINREFMRLFSMTRPLLKEGSMTRLTWAATANMANELWLLDVMGLPLAKTIAWAAHHEAVHKGANEVPLSVLHERAAWEEILLKEFREMVVRGLSSDKWSGWQAFVAKWNDVKPGVAAEGDDVGSKFGEHPVYHHNAYEHALPRAA